MAPDFPLPSVDRHCGKILVGCLFFELVCRNAATGQIATASEKALGSHGISNEAQNKVLPDGQVRIPVKRAARPVVRQQVALAAKGFMFPLCL